MVPPPLGYLPNHLALVFLFYQGSINRPVQHQESNPRASWTNSATTSPTTNQPSEQRSNRSALLIVFIVVFIDLLGFAIVLPLLPIIADTYIVRIVPEGEHAKFYEGMVLGLLMASFSLMQFIFAPIWGRVSDRVGRRPILLLGLGGSALFYALLGYACTLTGAQALLAVTLLFLARIGAGISGATIGTAQASSPIARRRRNANMASALIGAAFGIGFTFGPIFGYFALEWFPERLEAVGYTAAILSAGRVPGRRFSCSRRRGSGPRLRRPPPPGLGRSWNLGALFHAIGDPKVGAVILVFFLSTLGFASFETTLALFLDEVPVFGKRWPRSKRKKAKIAEHLVRHARPPPRC